MIAYADAAEVGAWLGVSAATVSKWRSRHATAHPCPEPDAMTGRTPGWLPTRREEWEEWRKGLPGQGWRSGKSG